MLGRGTCDDLGVNDGVGMIDSERMTPGPAIDDFIIGPAQTVSG